VISHLLHRIHVHALSSPDKTVFARIGRDGSINDQISFAGFEAWIQKMSCGLRRQVEHGAGIVLLYDTSFDFIKAFFSCIHAGLRPAAFQIPNSTYKFDRLLLQLEKAGIRHVLMTSRNHQKSWFRKLAEQHPHSDRLHWIMEDDCLSPATYQDDLKPDLNMDDTMYYQFTSGSTGTVKLIPVSAANVHHNVTAIGEVIHQHPDQIHLCWLPHYHDLGLVAGLFLPLCYGSTGYLLDPMDVAARPGLWLECISRYKATFTHTPNFGLDMCVDRITDPETLEKLDLSSLSGVMVCAEPIRKASLDRFRDRFCPFGFPVNGFVTCYGMAESTLAVTMQALDTEVHSIGDDIRGQTFISCGRPILGVTVRIANDSGDPAEVGEVVVSGSSLSGIFPASGLFSGDLGFLHDGELYITGRKKEIIIINGVNFLLHEIEYVIEQLPFVHERGALAYSVEGTNTEKLEVLIELKRSALTDPDLALLKNKVVRKLNMEFGISPREVYFFGPAVLLKTSSGKKMRHGWQQLLEKRLKTS
jgi:acyl-CoA synthetase (AMP-forming)/AMP-acid ligase II